MEPREQSDQIDFTALIPDERNACLGVCCDPNRRRINIGNPAGTIFHAQIYILFKQKQGMGEAT